MFEIRTPPKTRIYPRVYLAGPIDHAGDAAIDHEHGWRHADWLAEMSGMMGVKFWCPVCRARGKTDAEIMVNNMVALTTADAMVALFDTQIASFGTPIEINERAKRSPGSTFLVHVGKPGLFVRTLADNGEITLGQSFIEAKAWLIAFLR